MNFCKKITNRKTLPFLIIVPRRPLRVPHCLLCLVFRYIEANNFFSKNRVRGSRAILIFSEKSFVLVSRGFPQPMVYPWFKKPTTSGDREARILLNSFFASCLFSLYIAFDNLSSFTLSGNSSPVASQSKTAISVRSLSKAISIGVSSFSSVVAFALTLQRSIVSFF